jgi:hypothetical protein
VSPTRSNRSWWTPERTFFVLSVVAALVAMLVLTFLVHIGKVDSPFAAPAKQVTNLDIGNGVTVTGDKVPAKIKATTVDDGAATPALTAKGRKLIKPLTPLLDIGPSGSLKAPMTVSLTLSRKVTKADAITVLTNPTHKPDGWQKIPYTVSADKKHVLIVVDHLSLFQVFSTLIKQMMSMITEGLIDEVGSGAFSEASPPKCSDKATAESDGYSVKPTYKVADTLYYCFGYDTKTKDRVVKITNNRRYPLEIASSKMALLDTNVQSMSFVEIYRQHHHTIIMPRETLTFQVNPLKRGENASIKMSLSNWALGLGVMDTVYGVMLTVVSKGKATSVRKVIDVSSLSQDCIKNFDGESFKVGKLISSCFTETLLEKEFGKVVGALFATVTLLFAIFNDTRAIANALGDRRNDRDKYTVAVSRQSEVFPFPDTYYNHYTNVRLHANGTGQLMSTYGAHGCGDDQQTTRLRFCNFYGTFRYRQDGDTITGTFSKVHFGESKSGSSTSKKVTPAKSVRDAFPMINDLLHLQYDANKDQFRYKSIYLCGPKADQAAHGECGA